MGFGVAGRGFGERFGAGRRGGGDEPDCEAGDEEAEEGKRAGTAFGGRGDGGGDGRGKEAAERGGGAHGTA